jgi:hypothetical protein
MAQTDSSNWPQVENIAVALGSEFKIYLPQLIPQILRILMHDSRFNSLNCF